MTKAHLCHFFGLRQTYSWPTGAIGFTGLMGSIGLMGFIGLMGWIDLIFLMPVGFFLSTQAIVPPDVLVRNEY
jgi:hypothetical protein